MADIYHIKSISQVHQLFGMGKPAHPLIAVVREWPAIDFDFPNIKMTSDLYLLSLKGKIGKPFRYGRNSYDYQEGTLVFIAPGQVATFEHSDSERDQFGWTILFHPDLIRKSELGKTVKQYSFFDYDVNEALHLADKEKQFLNDLVAKIEEEIHQNLDKHSQDLIVHNLQAVLKYSSRYYDRQFFTRTNFHSDHVSRFLNFLEAFFNSPKLTHKGIPSVAQCGLALNMSGPYLSDLLKAETGKSAKDHIHSYIVEKAKTSLLNSSASISEIAFDLGFEYPQHFSKLYKAKTGLSPSEYRKLN